MNDKPEKYDAQAQLDRAQAAIFAIMGGGGDLTEEALKLSNEFTDATVARVRSKLRKPGKS
jgi:hypothetical protein